MTNTDRLNRMNTIHLEHQLSVAQPSRGCADCALRDRCLPAGLDVQETKLLDRLVIHNLHIERQGAVCRAGSAFRSLYAIRSGFVKDTVTHEDGRERVTSLHMPGELIGMDAINTGKYMCDTVALEDSNICAIPFGELERLTHDIPALQQNLHRTMSREIARDYEVMLLLGTTRAAERVKMFLLNLSKRYAARGYSATRINLRLKREDIGSHLGIKLETVSRVLSRFQEDDLIAVQHRNIEIKDLDRLNRMIGNDRESCLPYHRSQRRLPRSTRATSLPKAASFNNFTVFPAANSHAFAAKSPAGT